MISNPTEARSSSQARQELKQLAEITGAYAHFPTDPKQCREVMDKIAGEVSEHYTIGYYPANQTSDGRWRKLKVVVAAHANERYIDREVIQRSLVGAARLFPGNKKRRVEVWYEHIHHDDIVTSRAAHPERVPGIEDKAVLPRTRGEQRYRLAVFLKAWLVAIEYVRNAHEPSSLMGAARERLLARHTVPAVHTHGTARWKSRSGQHSNRMPENLFGARIGEPGAEYVPRA